VRRRGEEEKTAALMCNRRTLRALRDRKGECTKENTRGKVRGRDERARKERKREMPQDKRERTREVSVIAILLVLDGGGGGGSGAGGVRIVARPVATIMRVRSAVVTSRSFLVVIADGPL